MRIRTMLAAVALGGAALSGLTATTAHAATAGVYAKDNATCAAFKAYERHPDGIRFGRMRIDAAGAFWFLRADVTWWAKDRRHHAGPAELGQDAVMVAGDCADPAAQEDS